MIKASDDISDEQRRKRRTIASWALVIVWAIIIFAMSAKSGLELDSGNGIISHVKRWMTSTLSEWTGSQVDASPIGHFGEYFVFGALLMNALGNHISAAKAVFASIGIAALYAASDEIHQLFVPGRACDPLDWVVDVAAVALAAIIGWIIMRRTHRRQG